MDLKKHILITSLIFAVTTMSFVATSYAENVACTCMTQTCSPMPGSQGQIENMSGTRFVRIGDRYIPTYSFELKKAWYSAEPVTYSSPTDSTGWQCTYTP